MCSLNKLLKSLHSYKRILSYPVITRKLSFMNYNKFEGNNVPFAMHLLKSADAVCFDVDSTVIKEESIDIFAKYLSKYSEVSSLTNQAMNGELTFHLALSSRLNILQPSRKDIKSFMKQNPFQLSDNIEKLIRFLQNKNKVVYLISGGFRIMIEPIAEILNITKKNIFANTILFDKNNSYDGFDEREYTCRDYGKQRVLEHLKEKYMYDNIVMVGDGMNDVQAKPPADVFIGYGGNVIRNIVKENSCWYIYDYKSMINVLKNTED